MVKLYSAVRKHAMGKTGLDDRGVSAVEYALLLFFVSLVIFGSVTLLGGHLKTIFGNVNNSLPHSSTSATPTPSDSCGGGGHGGDSPCHGGG
jgi:pilus assembly protein Flp/PilA